ncbi:MFS transporter [Sulfitobacter pseudonitzschiae]|uniref:MFS transporter n=1 Tax=Pseudosulfitobacter pseudonitzschiae TaxID=1402135 RepID=A0A9Q2RW70_9RHOB|nr:MFS transporter [Pseudosulfitobacter pseudonitzschiae]MBM2291111.1 MFS transporter [Pseudosulfitobacter pseudonitzschiae]MBM2296029.1 MFS transporter [Pseudosulfitobacter pseudonitzschiae]MBM2300942.1 MFS transporter [Pseudosulfitobacter pseudonitzschiae]MBM2310726.1 MFS transporter [Pseudosulfitobacter pseudonitzschiae]MBM2315639.1 MFS transporter [Pseudosulfitobacter pseudonitzschiae]
MSKLIPVSLLALGLFTVTFAVNLQAPLYDVYAAESDVGATAVTVAFAAYVGGLMPTLLLLGGLSDRIGRRVPIALALIMGAVATALLVQVPSWTSLVVARFLLGIGTGLATTAGTAYMTEILGSYRAKNAALIVTSATSLGFGGGALATGISLGVQGPTLLPASYIALFVAAPILAVIALGLPRIDKRLSVSLLRLPVFPSGTWMFGAAMALAWSTTGMTIAVIPLELAANDLGGWTGLVIFLAIFVGFLCQPIARRMTNDRALALGFVLIPLGFLVLLAGVWLKVLAFVLVGTCITSAASYGFTYLASLAEVSLRAPDDRARATAGLFVYAYFGFSLPVIASGALADMVGLVSAMAVFAAVQITVTAIIVMIWKSGAVPPGAAVPD